MWNCDSDSDKRVHTLARTHLAAHWDSRARAWRSRSHARTLAIGGLDVRGIQHSWGRGKARFIAHRTGRVLLCLQTCHRKSLRRPRFAGAGPPATCTLSQGANPAKLLRRGDTGPCGAPANGPCVGHQRQRVSTRSALTGPLLPAATTSRWQKCPPRAPGGPAGESRALRPANPRGTCSQGQPAPAL
jgi:hypothetical protein